MSYINEFTIWALKRGLMSQLFKCHLEVTERSFVKVWSICQWKFPIFTIIMSLEIAKYSLSDESTFGKYQIYPYCFMTRFHFPGHSLSGLRNLRYLHYKANPPERENFLKIPSIILMYLTAAQILLNSFNISHRPTGYSNRIQVKILPLV